MSLKQKRIWFIIREMQMKTAMIYPVPHIHLDASWQNQNSNSKKLKTEMNKSWLGGREMGTFVRSWWEC